MSYSLRSFISGIFMSACAATAMAQEAKEPVYVDMHVQIVLDDSASMTKPERDLMYRGLARGLVSKEVCNSLDGGQYYAVSLTKYGDSVLRYKSEILHTCLEARDFAQKYIWDFDKNHPQRNLADVGTSTNTPEALRVAGMLFEREREYGFISTNRTVVLAGDDDGPNGVVKPMVRRLAEIYNATTYGAAITLEDGNKVETFFNDNIKTDANLFYTAPDGSKRIVKKGNSMAINTPEQMEIIVAEALRLSLG